MSPRACLFLLLPLVLPFLSVRLAEGQAGAVEVAIEGRVTDRRGEPIEGAEVWVYPGLTEAGFPRDEELRKPLRTGPDGRFRAAERLERGKRYEIFVKRAGYVDASLPGVQAPTSEPLKVEMAVARNLSGQVVGPEGEPIAGASVAWAREVGESYTTGLISSSGSMGGSRPLGTTDADGRFRVSGPPPGQVELFVTAEGYASRRIEGLQLPEDRDLENVKITLQHGILLEVQVLDAEGAPVPDAWVHAEPEDLDLRPESPRFHSVDADTDSAGRCRLTVPEPGVYLVDASPDMVQRVVVEPGARRVEVLLQPDRNPKPPPDRPAEGKPAWLSTETPPRKGFTLTGRILMDGKPLSRGEIGVHGESTAFGPSYISHDGTFTIQGMPAGRSILVVTDSNGFVGAHTVSLTEDQNLSIELFTGRLRGRVVSATGEPVEDAAVTVEGWIPAIRGAVSAPSGRTGADGTFEVPRLGAGTYKVKVSKEGYAPAEATAEVPAGGVSAPVAVVLKAREETP
jgi:protocatechuate 3,4-dioxygenase beta subunit